MPLPPFGIYDLSYAPLPVKIGQSPGPRFLGRTSAASRPYRSVRGSLEAVAAFRRAYCCTGLGALSLHDSGRHWSLPMAPFGMSLTHPADIVATAALHLRLALPRLFNHQLRQVTHL